jgi:hypothetical protein
MKARKSIIKSLHRFGLAASIVLTALFLFHLELAQGVSCITQDCANPAGEAGECRTTSITPCNFCATGEAASCFTDVTDFVACGARFRCVFDQCQCTANPLPSPVCKPNAGASCTSDVANNCGQKNTGTINCDGTCSASTPPDPAGLGDSCNPANSCGQTNSGVIRCDGTCSVSPPANPPNLGASCTAANNCGTTNTGTIQCDASGNTSCSAKAPPDLADCSCPLPPANFGAPCSPKNTCGDSNTGKILCDGTCSVSAPAVPPTLGNSCNPANSCGQTSAGKVLCDGTCSVTAPPDSGCPAGRGGSCGALTACTSGSGASVCCANGCDATQSSGCAIPPAPTCIGSNGQRYAAGGTQSCVSGANSCGQTNNGTETCGSGGSWSACSASAPANPANFGKACKSSANNCGETNAGTIKCDGTTCSASAPADRASCNSIGDKGYVCQNNTSCVPVASGATYTTTSTCEAACPLPSIGGKGYVCQNNTSCVPVASGATYTTTSTCQAACGSGPPPSLSVSLSASPSTAAVPFSSTLGATIQSSDNASTVNYTFFWNCNYAGTSVSVAITSCGALPAPVSGSCVSNQNGAKCDGILSHTKTAVSPPYQTAGSYHPLVIVEQGSFPPARGSAVVTATVPVVGGSGYNCQNNACVFAASGATYTTSSSCQAACNSGSPIQPTITITARPSSIITGATSTITWSSVNTQPSTTCTLQGQSVNPNGSLIVSPRVTTQYVLSCLTPGPGNPAPAQAAITVKVSQNPGLIEIAP